MYNWEKCLEMLEQEAPNGEWVKLQADLNKGDFEDIPADIEIEYFEGANHVRLIPEKREPPCDTQ